jgi:hypothetical protein
VCLCIVLTWCSNVCTHVLDQVLQLLEDPANLEDLFSDVELGWLVAPLTHHINAKLAGGGASGTLGSGGAGACGELASPKGPSCFNEGDVVRVESSDRASDNGSRNSEAEPLRMAQDRASEKGPDRASENGSKKSEAETVEGGGAETGASQEANQENAGDDGNSYHRPCADRTSHSLPSSKLQDASAHVEDQSTNAPCTTTDPAASADASAASASMANGDRVDVVEESVTDRPDAAHTSNVGCTTIQRPKPNFSTLDVDAFLRNLHASEQHPAPALPQN